MRDKEILKKLKSLSDPKAVEGMAKYGINPENNYGVSISMIRELAKDVGKDHQLAERLWSSGIRDARLVAALIEDPKNISEKQMERWVGDFNSWDVCDHCCSVLFRYTEFAYEKAIEWSSREEEFVKRASFSLIAGLAVKDKKAEDSKFEQFLPIIKREAIDDRNYVKKAVNWALRGVGKRNLELNKKALKTAKEIQKMDSKSARWIATDAIRELKSEKIQNRLRRRNL